jgi:hypothetical protein
LLWILVTVSPLPAVALARGAVSVALADATWCAAKGPSVSHPPQPSGLANSECMHKHVALKCQLKPKPPSKCKEFVENLAWRAPTYVRADGRMAGPFRPSLPFPPEWQRKFCAPVGHSNIKSWISQTICASTSKVWWCGHEPSAIGPAVVVAVRGHFWQRLSSWFVAGEVVPPCLAAMCRPSQQGVPLYTWLLGLICGTANQTNGGCT